MPHISVVSPVYRAEKCVPELCRRLKRALSSITEDFEIILVEDRSPDNSWTAILDEATKDTRVRGVRLAKNFGQHRAITAGLDIATGDWVIVMDCDLQDPPEEIPNLYAKAIEGYEIVLAQFEERSGSGLKHKVSSTFWNFLGWLADTKFDHRIGNFRIMSRKVVDNFLQYREQLRLLGGITALMGFTTATFPMKRDERFAGETSYTFSKLLAVAVELALAYSDKPLKISVIAGLIIAVSAAIIGSAIAVLSLNGIIEVQGWTSVMVSIYLIGGLIIANLGIVGYYIGRIFDETKRRPLYIVENRTDAANAVVIGATKGIDTKGSVVWITGLSGAGKSTLAVEVAKRFRSRGDKVVVLDGDELRGVFGAVADNLQNHGRGGRLALAMQYAQLSSVIASQGLTVVIATISLFREVHVWNRENLPGYFEVYLKVPFEELRRRDPKGIYLRYDSGELSNVAGLDLPIDEPEAADWVVEFVPGQKISGLATELINNFMKKTNI